jgi:hypothetical protein
MKQFFINVWNVIKEIRGAAAEARLRNQGH